MSWIREIETEEAQGELKVVYDQLLESRGKVANILKVHSLNPGSMRTHLEMYMQLMFARSRLSRGEREAIAVAVSAANDCAYCVNHHAEALGRFEKDPARLKQLAADYSKVTDLSERHRAILDYATRLTRTPAEVSERDMDKLREAGLSDEEILDTALVTAYFNFVNRMALGLGVSFSEDELEGYTEAPG
jgi:uncharacterized peroxidase-related enzyme